MQNPKFLVFPTCRDLWTNAGKNGILLVEKEATKGKPEIIVIGYPKAHKHRYANACERLGLLRIKFNY